MLVIIESPYMGLVKTNLSYARKCMLDSLMRGESPFASHLLYTQVLDDTIAEQRAMGLQRAFNWYECAELMAVYTDLGITAGMKLGVKKAKELSIDIEYRTLNGNNS